MDVKAYENIDAVKYQERGEEKVLGDKPYHKAMTVDRKPALAVDATAPWPIDPPKGEPAGSLREFFGGIVSNTIDVVAFGLLDLIGIAIVLITIVAGTVVGGLYGLLIVLVLFLLALISELERAVVYAVKTPVEFVKKQL
jgi:hypothetical protein